MIAFSEGKSYNSLKGQSKRIGSPWRYREGPGFRGELIPHQADGDMVSWQTAGAHHCGPRAVCQPRLPQQRGQCQARWGSGQLSSQHRCLSFSGENSKMWPQSKWLLRAVCSPDPGGANGHSSWARTSDNCPRVRKMWLRPGRGSNTAYETRISLKHCQNSLHKFWLTVFYYTSGEDILCFSVIYFFLSRLFKILLLDF